MDSALKVNDVVWAKVRSYPWWPAIITQINDKDPDNFEYRVDFISENTHYFLPKKHVKIFEGNIELPGDKKDSSKQNQTLYKAILVAHKINCGELQREDLHQLNLTYFSKASAGDMSKKRQTKDEEKKSRIKILQSKIEEMTKTHNFLPEDSGFEQSMVKEIEKKLASFISSEVTYEEVNKLDLLEAFEKLSDYEPHEEILKNLFILKSLKYFYREFENSADYHLAIMAKLAYRLYLYWRAVAYQESLETVKENDAEIKNESDEELEKIRKRKKTEEGTGKKPKTKKETESDSD